MSKRIILLIVAFALTLNVSIAAPGSARHQPLQHEFKRLTDGFDGRVAVCATDSAGAACVNERRALPNFGVLAASI